MHSKKNREIKEIYERKNTTIPYDHRGRPFGRNPAWFMSARLQKKVRIS